MASSAQVSRTGIVVPLRGFAGAHTRLASVLSEAQRARLAETLAGIVLAACPPHPALVVTSDPEVTRWAQGLGVRVIADPGSLDEAAVAGQAHWAAAGMGRVVIAHGDLVAVRTFDAVIDDAGADDVILVPCRRNDGTTVISLPADLPFAFAYGAGSFERHRANGPARIVLDEALRLDIDLPDDLDALPSGLRHDLGITSSTQTG